jgi:hypothetical protein
VSPTQIKGEFDNFDPNCIAERARIKTDCSVNWINSDDGMRYCLERRVAGIRSGRSPGEHRNSLAGLTQAESLGGGLVAFVERWGPAKEWTSKSRELSG